MPCRLSFDFREGKIVKNIWGQVYHIQTRNGRQVDPDIQPCWFWSLADAKKWAIEQGIKLLEESL